MSVFSNQNTVVNLDKKSIGNSDTISRLMVYQGRFFKTNFASTINLNVMQTKMLGQSKAAFDFVSSPKRLLINNEWVNSVGGTTSETFNPTNEEKLCDVAMANSQDVDIAVAAAKAAYENVWKDMNPHERAKYLYRIADLIEKNVDELAEIQTYDMGMILAHAKMMVAAQADTFRYYAGWITKVTGQTFPSEGSSFTYSLREPLGVIGGIIPWNGPFLAASWKIAPAIAFGNTIVLKAGTEAPLAPLRLGELIVEAGLPAGVVNIISGSGSDAGQRLVDHPDVAKISFTGSTRIGQHLLRSSADTLKKITLELGGKSPTIIFADADMKKAVYGAVVGFVAGAGQGCVLGTRIFVQETVYENVKNAIANAVSNLKIGSPFEADTLVAPMAFKRHYDTVCSYLEIGKEQGANAATGGEKLGGKGYFVKPTLFENVTDEMRIYKDEIFGPVATIIPFKDEAEVIKMANNSEYGLAGSIWTSDLNTAHRVSSKVKSGILWVNTNLEMDVKAPFGGFKLSGIGTEHGYECIDAFTKTKTVVMRF